VIHISFRNHISWGMDAQSAGWASGKASTEYQGLHAHGQSGRNVVSHHGRDLLSRIIPSDNFRFSINSEKLILEPMN
jgi:hypothetical protein